MTMRNASGAVLAVLLAFLLAVGGCGGDSGGDDDGGQQPPPQQLIFNSSTMVEAGVVAVDVVEIFPDVTEVFLAVLDSLPNPPSRAAAGRTAALIIDLGDLGLCANEGGSALSLNDADNSLSLSVDDSASLEFTSCALDPRSTNEVLSGTLTVTFTAVSLPTSVAGRMASTGLTLTDLSSGGGTETLTMDFGIQIAQTSPTERTVIYGDPTAEDTIGFAGSDDTGSFSVEFGCFDVTQVFDLPQGSIPTYTLAPRGIVNFDGLIMQMGSYETATMDVPLNIEGLIATAGTITLFNFDGRPTGPCSVVGSDGATPAVISAERITATGGGDVMIETFDDAALTPPPNETDLSHTWMDLVDL